MSAMSIIGIDFGNESCFVAAAKSGGIETLANDYSLRATPSYVAFSAKNRILGVAAKNQQITNIKNTIYGFKRLLGRKFDDAVVQAELKYLPYRVIRNENGSIGIEVNYLSERNVFSPEQCTAMLLTKLRETASDALQVPINDCVVSVPSYFTNAERQALLNAVQIAGLNCLRLFNETTATALAYGIYKQDLPNVDEAPRNVVFVDMGHAALQVFTCAFNRGKLKIISCESEPNIGGRNIDWILADYFCEQFQKNFGVNIKSNSRAYLRLLSEVEKLKKQMSANSTVLPIGIECIMDEKDVSGKMKRADMEVLCEPLMEKIEKVFVKCLQSSQLDVNSVHSVEIVGGSSRVPFVKALIEKVFQKTASTTLNQDEAVSRGCALQCAILSPAVKVRDYAVQDIQLYPISLNYDENDKNYQLELFPLYQAIPFTKALTLARNHDFSLNAFYSGPIPFSDNFICSWKVSGIKATDDQHKVKIKFRVNQHGILVLTSAVIYEKVDNSDSEASMDVDANNGNQNHNGPTKNKESSDSETQEPEGGNGETNESVDEKKTVSDEKLAEKKVKPHIVAVGLSVSSVITGVVDNVNQYVEEEFKMISNDKLEKERIDSKNALEEYVYDLRNKLTTEDDLYSFVLEKDRTSLTARLDDIENWLYDEGEDSNRQTYCDKLANLKDQGEPIKMRKMEFEMRPRLFEEFSLALQLSQKFVEKWQQNDPKFAHVTSDEVNKVQNAVQDKCKWLDETRADFVNLQKHENPRISASDILVEKQSFEQMVTPIIRKPVPKVDEPKAADGQPDKNQQQNAAPNAGEHANEDKQPETAAAAANGEMETE